MVVVSTLVLATLLQADALPRRGALGLASGPVPKEQAASLKLEEGTGLTVIEVVPGLTADKAKLMKGDIIAKINGKSVAPQTLGEMARNLPSTQVVNFEIRRGDKTITLRTDMVEKPRDPGTDLYTVNYSHIVSNGKRMRTIITTPKKPGKYPAFFFIQGFSPNSYDFTLSTSTGDVKTIDGPLLHQFASEGFVTFRVEKPGVGDSEGGPFADMDYTTELDIYRQTLKQIKEHGGVDKDNIFIFGHSMGGAFGPMIAAESPVKGIATYGTAARTWFEYLLDIIRYQGVLAGQTLPAADDEMRIAAQVFAQVIIERKSPAALKKSHPQLAPYADAYFPGGLFNQKTLEFWRQLNDINFPKQWVNANCRVLSVRGVSDYVTYDADHKVIADAVNAVHPGWGKFELCPDSDHLFHDWATEKDSMKGWTKGKFSMNFSNMMMKWIRDVIAEK
ncbi:MAG: alpha/beta fold hydrolase [Armatimonadota bacterium]